MRIITAFAFALLLSACAVFDPLVYKIDIPQGNYIEQQDVDRLRIGMSKEQVRYVLGSPVSENAFRADDWHYVYHLKPGRGSIYQRNLTVHFEYGTVARLSGDFEVPEAFYTPLEN
ncbi:outer membrane protein assembly factor BamE [Aliidiomarina sanyensis]|uniref:Outer membrane protein assembly factor BamE n=1 Tax=Aliidiomarina sanyensis TaxID=1249555 RepID=A0A432WDN7_9GAMM|nr:outer membrane protein assembly factor BamE [Aliidiomarina sanyensis]RUO30531.1 outer membrane protein assembly factor BamE [Aliidiomarina sanyensis]